MAALLGTSIVFTGCTTEQRGGRTTGEYIDDKQLTGRVKDALDDNPAYKFDDVKVQSYMGTVQLSGFVATDEQKDRAAEIAKNVRGVDKVENKITVQAAGAPAR